MTQAHKVTPTTRATRTAAKPVDPLTRIRSAVQELHRSISDAAALGTELVKADWKENLAQAKAVTESIEASAALQNDVTKQQLTEAVGYLEATQKHITASLKHTGHAFQRSLRHSLSDARAAAQKVSEALAAKRTAAATSKGK